MRAPSASELLDVWECGLTQPPTQRALTLLAAACPETPQDVLARFSIGQRDARLLTLREWVFGSQLQTLAACPDCRERLDVSFSVEDIRVSSPAPSLSTNRADEDGDEMLSLGVADYELCFRLPNSQDLAVMDGLGDAAARRRALLRRCLSSIVYHGAGQAPDSLSMEVEAAVVAQMAQANPQAEVNLSLSCPSCACQWQAVFDIASFFWTEIDAWARRLLRDVHRLAVAYGWRESDILAMSPLRRQLYLNMLGG